MQQHLGEHVLAGAIHELLGGYTIGLHMGASASTIDVTMPDKRLRLTEAEVLTLEETVNGRLQQNLAVKCWFPDAQELQRLPLRKPPPAVNNVRIVDVGGIEMVACGGTHPATTGQAGQLKVLDTQPARGKMRVSFVCGMRTVRYFHALYNTAVQAQAAVQLPGSPRRRNVKNGSRHGEPAGRACANEESLCPSAGRSMPVECAAIAPRLEIGGNRA